MAGGPQVAWMPIPAQLPDCPAGLEYLTSIDQVLVHQVVELLEAFTGWETKNKYAVKNAMGQQIYYAFEESRLCARFFCQANRGFTMHVVDNFNREVMRVERELKCCACCSWFAGCCNMCSHNVTVEAPPGTVIGYARQTCAWCSLNMEIYDADNKPQLYIDGPCCTCKCCCDIEFPIYGNDRSTQVGLVTKQFSGLAREIFTESDNFGLIFPKDLDVRTKATLIGALFLIDFMEFEDKTQPDNRNIPSIT